MTTNGRRVVGLGISVALHSVLFGILILLASAPRTTTSRQDAPPLAMVYVRAPGEPTAADTLTEDQSLEAAAGQAELQMPGFEYDIGKIQARQDTLFPFLTERLSVVDDLRAMAAARSAKLTWFTPFSPSRPRSGLPPLSLTDAQVKDLVDEAWSRRERWRNFLEIATLVTTHDPDEGRAPELLRTHLDQNLLQPYYDTETRDPRFWVMLGLAADHGPLIRFVSRFAREHPSTRASTELLFLLDEFTQASRDALLMLMATEPERDLRLTRRAGAGAYELASSIRRRYGDWLQESGLRRTHDVRSHYDRIRLRILSAIVETTPQGYGAADARYLAGRIMWDQNNVEEALRWWREITPDERRMYERDYTPVLREVRSLSGSSAATINRLLGAEYRRWLEFSASRLREFGYALDTF